MGNRILAILLSLAMVLSLAAQPAYGDTFGAFADNEPPVINIASPLPDTKVGGSGNVNVSGTISEECNLTIKVGGVEKESLTNVSGYFSESINLSEGDSVITVEATDKANNKATQIVKVLVDRTAPTINVTYSNATNSASLPIDITITNADNNTVDLKVMSGSENGTVVYSARTKSASVSLPLSNEGINNFTIAATDDFGNKAVKSDISITRDTVPPMITIQGVQDGDIISSSVTINVSSSEGAWTADLYKGAEKVKTYNGNPITIDKVDNEAHDYTLKVTAKDNVDNQAYEEISFTIDATVPEITIAKTPADNMTKQDVDVTVSSPGAALSLEIKKNNSNYAYNDSDSNADIIKTILTQDGVYELRAIAAKNGKTAAKTVNVTIDKNPPNISITGVTEGQKYTAAVTPVFSAEDNHDGTPTVIATLKKGNGTPLQFQSGSRVDSNGAYVLTVTANDDVMNQATRTISFTVDISSGYPSGGVVTPPTGNNQDNTNSTQNTYKEISADKDKAAFKHTENSRITFKAVNVVVEIPKDALNISGDIYAKQLSADDIKNQKIAMPKEEKTAKYMMAGKVFELTAPAVEFKKPVKVIFPYEKSANIKDPKKLGVYRYNEKSNVWEYAGGIVDEQKGIVTVSLDHFSKYCVMYLEKTFEDIAKHWAKSDIELMASKHIAQGSEGKFNPNNKISRVEFIALLLRSIGVKVNDGKTEFKDVAADSWYAPYVKSACELKIAVPNSKTEFKPLENITREEMSLMIMRAYSYVTGKDYTKEEWKGYTEFADMNAISKDALYAVKAANSLGIVKGLPGNKFGGGQTATRAEVITMIKRLLEKTSRL